MSSCKSDDINGCSSCAPAAQLFYVNATLGSETNVHAYICPENGDETKEPLCYTTGRVNAIRQNVCGDPNPDAGKRGSNCLNKTWTDECDGQVVGRGETSSGGYYNYFYTTEIQSNSDGGLYNKINHTITAEQTYLLKQLIFPNYGCSPLGKEDWTFVANYSLKVNTDGCGNVISDPKYRTNVNRTVNGPDGSSSLEKVNGCRNVYNENGTFIEAVADYYLQECGFWGCEEYTGLVPCNVPLCNLVGCVGDPEKLTGIISMKELEAAIYEAITKRLAKLEKNKKYDCGINKGNRFCDGDDHGCWNFGGLSGTTFSNEILIFDRSIGRVSTASSKWRIGFIKNELERQKIKKISGKVYFYIQDENFPEKTPCCNSDFGGIVLKASPFDVGLGSLTMIKGNNTKYVYYDLDYVFDFLKTSKSHKNKSLGSCVSIESVQYI